MRKIYFLIGPIIFIITWEIICLFGFVNNFFLPEPIEVFFTLYQLLTSGEILNDLFATLYRVFVALGLAIVVGFPLGLLLGLNKKIYKNCEFIIDFFRSMPSIAIFPLFVLLFGIGDNAKIAVAVFASILIIIFNTSRGIINSKKTRLLAAKLMGATKYQIFTKIALWESLPQTIIGLRTAASLTLIVIIATEMFIGTYAGIGKRIIDFQYIYNIKGMYALILITGLFGFAINYIFIYLEKRYIHWAGK